jgi:hypothetical protein
MHFRTVVRLVVMGAVLALLLWLSSGAAALAEDPPDATIHTTEELAELRQMVISLETQNSTLRNEITLLSDKLKRLSAGQPEANDPNAVDFTGMTVPEAQKALGKAFDPLHKLETTTDGVTTWRADRVGAKDEPENTYPMTVVLLWVEDGKVARGAVKLVKEQVPIKHSLNIRG